jgi:hypothetical protein
VKLVIRNLRRWPRRALDWLCRDRADYREFRRRAARSDHRRRKQVCVWVWIGALGLVALHPTAPLAIAAVLTATFLSFAILDG